MERCLCRGTEWNCDIHELGVLGCPLVRLGTAHRPTDNGTQVGDAKFLDDKFMLGTNVVIE